MASVCLLLACTTSKSWRWLLPAERELRVDLQGLIDAGVLEAIPHEGWLTTRDQFKRSQKSRPWRMDAFYRLVRRESGILMRDGKPVGDKFSFDAENRWPWALVSPCFCCPETTPPQSICDQATDTPPNRSLADRGTLA